MKCGHDGGPVRLVIENRPGRSGAWQRCVLCDRLRDRVRDHRRYYARTLNYYWTSPRRAAYLRALHRRLRGRIQAAELKRRAWTGAAA